MDKIKILSWNIFHSSYKKILPIIENNSYDLILLQECDFSFPRTFFKNNAKSLAHTLNMDFVTSNVSANFNFPFNLFSTGIATLSSKKLECHFKTIEFLSQKKHIRRSIIANIKITDLKISIANVHFQSANQIIKNENVAKLQLLELIQDYSPDIIAGDFNLNLEKVSNTIKNTQYKIMHNENSYPSANPNKQIDFFLSKKNYRISTKSFKKTNISDHIGFEYTLFFN